MRIGCPGTEQIVRKVAPGDRLRRDHQRQPRPETGRGAASAGATMPVPAPASRPEPQPVALRLVAAFVAQALGQAEEPVLRAGAPASYAGPAPARRQRLDIAA